MGAAYSSLPDFFSAPQVHFINGTVRTMPRRERPQLYLDAALTPRVLYTGLVVSGTSVTNPAFTSAQEILVS